MYTRVVELTSKSGKARELCNSIDEKVLPILKKQPGFVGDRFGVGHRVESGIGVELLEQ
jgi:hypothetical protein